MTAKFVCHYCGEKFYGYLYAGDLDYPSCPVCKSRSYVEHIDDRDEDRDPFGYYKTSPKKKNTT